MCSCFPASASCCCPVMHYAGMSLSRLSCPPTTLPPSPAFSAPIPLHSPSYHHHRLQVFAAAGLGSPIAASIITGGVNLLFTIAAAVAMDRCVCVRWWWWWRRYACERVYGRGHRSRDVCSPGDRVMCIVWFEMQTMCGCPSADSSFQDSLLSALFHLLQMPLSILVCRHTATAASLTPLL